MKTNTLLNRLIWLVVAAPLVYLAIIWNKLPERIAIHFTIEGVPDRYGNKSELVVLALVLAGMSGLVYLLLTNIYRIDPKKTAVENKTRLAKIGFAIAVFMSAILFVIIYGSMKGTMKFSIKIIFAGIGLLYCLLGNYMHTIKPNYFAGFRLPWTLENEDNWKKTHLLGGKLFFAGGLLIAVLCLLVPVTASFIIMMSITMITVIITCVYSFLLYKENKKLNKTK